MITPLRIGVEFVDGKGGIGKVSAQMQKLAKDARSMFANQRDGGLGSLKAQLAEERAELKAITKAVDEETRAYNKLAAAKETAMGRAKNKAQREMIAAEYDSQLAASKRSLDARTSEMRMYQDAVAQTETRLKGAKEAADDAGKSTSYFGRRIKGLAASALMFSVVTQALTALRKGLFNLIQSDTQAAKSLAQIRSGLISAFMPIYNVALPAIRALLSFLAQLVNAIASVIGGLFGTSGAAKGTASALGGAGKAGGSAAKSLAAFDEINQLTDGGGGGGGGGGGIGSLLGDTSGLDNVSEKMKNIAKWVLAIGTGMAAWKIFSKVGLTGKGSFLFNLKEIAGIVVAIRGAMEIIPASVDAWNNGITTTNNAQHLKGTVGFVGGMAFAFGKLGFMIALAVDGITNMTIGIRDIVKNGFSLENVGTTLTGIGEELLMIGLATGNPILIGIAAFITALGAVIANWKTICEWIDTAIGKFKEFIHWEDMEKNSKGAVENITGSEQLAESSTPLFAAVIATDPNNWAIAAEADSRNSRGRTDYMSRSGHAYRNFEPTTISRTPSSAESRKKRNESQAEEIGITGSNVTVIGQTAMGVVRSDVGGALSRGTVSAAADKKELKNIVKTTEKETGKLLKPAVKQVVKDADVSGAVAGVTPEAVRGANNAMNAMEAQLAKFGPWLKNTMANAWRSASSVFTGTGTGSISDGISSTFRSMLNSLISKLNNMFSNVFGQLNKAFSNLRGVSVNGSYPFSNLATIKVSSIPKLAAGAVIPANREFLAVLGDQTHGTNIEAPLDTIVEAMKIALRGNGGGDVAAAIRQAFVGLAIKVDKTTIGYVVADSINANRRASGKVALNL